MYHLAGIIVLITFAVDVKAACDINGLNQCVSSAVPTDNTRENDPCVQYNAIKKCVAMFNATCATEIKSYTDNIAQFESMCGGGGMGGGGDGCDMQALSGCMTSMSSIQGAMSSGSAPTGEDLENVCNGYAAFKACVAALPPACSETLKNNQMGGEQFSQLVDQYCGSSDGCDMIGVQKCMMPIMSLDLKFDGESAMSSIVKVSSQCGSFEGVLDCLEPKLEGCKDNTLLQNTTVFLEKMKMMVNFVCKEKKQSIMEVAECASKPAALQKLSECESIHPMSSDPSKVSKEQLCTEVNTMSACMEKATSGVCTGKETETMIDLLKDAMKMFLKGEDPCEVSGAGMLVSSVWTSLVLAIAAIFL
ncbi:uncharacterized protein LOC132556497 [Ylistrum balloti]|uniref:uncharacterized protein LOC132556497 n=1 Tax=Ylistrum balloti TaxID=509963 RepID=UPI002905A6C9|nr:uncharacterized protein LOC132556497 [Ylistrum balloti]